GCPRGGRRLRRAARGHARRSRGVGRRPAGHPRVRHRRRPAPRWPVSHLARHPRQLRRRHPAAVRQALRRSRTRHRARDARIRRRRARRPVPRGRTLLPARSRVRSRDPRRARVRHRCRSPVRPRAAMTIAVTPEPAATAPAVSALPLICRNCGRVRDAGPAAICDECLGPLEPVYDPHRALPDRETIAARAPSLWRYREWLPLVGEPAYSRDTGCTPLVEAPRLAQRLGVARAWVKNDTVSHPSLSFKDRVVSVAINAAAAFGIGTLGCASTGNLANAVAAHAARAGLDAWVFIPHDLELGKVAATAIFAPHLVRVRGTYDDVNRLCAQAADRFGWGIVNVNLRSYYGEGSKTMAFEIAEQLGWRLPSAVIAPMAGGSLVTKLRKGFGEFLSAGLVEGNVPRIFGAQASGCAPIARLVERGDDELLPEV